MSMDPNMIAQMLMQGGQGQSPQQGSQPSGLGMGNNLLQQVLMMQQLKQRLGQMPQQQQPIQPPGAPMPQTQVGNAMGPGTNA